jgi:hypothetical protein
MKLLAESSLHAEISCGSRIRFDVSEGGFAQVLAGVDACHVTSRLIPS